MTFSLNNIIPEYPDILLVDVDDVDVNGQCLIFSLAHGDYKCYSRSSAGNNINNKLV